MKLDELFDEGESECEQPMRPSSECKWHFVHNCNNVQDNRNSISIYFQWRCNFRLSLCAKVYLSRK